MTDNSLYMLSESMQMYIVTIARLWENRQPVPLSKLADVFSISPVSVNEMCRKLQDNGLVHYQPYKGASLTTAGEEKANYILRRHRLWEVFLSNQLNMSFSEAHEIACQLEHATPDILADRLDAFLAYPATNPIGEPIPRDHSPLPSASLVSLDMLAVGQQAQIIRCDVDEAALLFLQKAGLQPGVLVDIIAATEDGSLLQFGDGKTISLSRELEKSIHVFIAGQDRENPSNDLLERNPVTPEHKELSKVNEIQSQEKKQITVERTTLNQLRVGQRGVVIRVRAKGQIRQRLIDMGLVPGSEIKVVRTAPLGDPIEFTIKGYNLSLRKSEASEIEIEVAE